MRHKSDIYLYNIAAFMIALMLTMPFYISDVHAQVNSPQRIVLESGGDPFIKTSIPSAHPSTRIDITGETVAGSEVKLYVDDYLSRRIGPEMTQSGNFSFRNVELNDQRTNQIRIQATSSQDRTNEVSGEIYVDSVPPTVNISEIPARYHQFSLRVNGTISKNVTAQYTVIADNPETREAPAAVTNVHIDNNDRLQNSVSVAWVDRDIAENFLHYAIYRRDVGLIATADSSPFTDVLVNSGQTYEYDVRAVNSYCRESPPATVQVTTPTGGNTQVPVPEARESSCRTTQPQHTVEIRDGRIDTMLNLNAGQNIIILNFTDRAGNSLVIRNTTYVDTEAPTILEDSLNIPSLNPSYVRNVEVTGMISENATVFLYLNNKTAPEGMVYTNSDGSFSIDVELQRSFDFATQTGTGTHSVSGETGNTWINFIDIVAIDDAGLNSTWSGTIIYALCGEGADWNVISSEPTPGIILPRMIIEGISQIGFDAEFTWQGIGNPDEAIISRAYLTPMPLNAEQAEDYDSSWIRSLPDPAHDPRWKNAYFLINLNAPLPIENTTVEAENNISDHRIGECGVPGTGCIKLPLVLNIEYSYYDPYNKTAAVGIQKQCINFNVMIDRRMPPSAVPTSFLNSTVSVLNTTINLIDNVLEPVKTARKIALITCFGSWVIWFVMKASEYFSCVNEDPETCNPEESNNGENCKSCLQAKSNTINFWIKSQWVCDRVLCPAAPTVQKYIRDMNVEGSRSHCADMGVGDVKFDKSKEDDEYKEFIDPKNMHLFVRPNAENSNIGKPNKDYCEYEYMMNTDSVSVFMNEYKESFCLTYPDTDEQQKKGIDCGGLGGVFRLFGGICTNEPGGEMTMLVREQSREFYFIIKEDNDVREAFAAEKTYGTETGHENGVPFSRSVTRYQSTGGPILSIRQCDMKYEELPNKGQASQDKVPREVYDEICRPAGEYVVDPTSDLVTAFRSVCLTAMASYLQHWRTILAMARNCLTTIMLTGDGSAGVCKQFMTIYLCDLIYFAIKCISEKASKGFGEPVQPGIGGFLGYMQSSSANMQQSIGSRYGTTGVYKTLFVERKLIHSVCAFAFTGDWSLDLDALLDQEGTVPIDSTCVITGTRRFIAKDPSAGGNAKFIYHMGALVVSGADDLRYTVELVCSARTDCTSDISSDGQCDCFRNGKGEQKSIVAIGPGHLSQGGTVNDEAYLQKIDPYRYDRARILISYTDNMNQKIENKVCAESRILQVGNPPPADCKFDLANLMFHCSFEWGDVGTAKFQGRVEFEDDKEEFYVGEKLYINGEIFKQDRSSSINERMFLRVKLYRQGSPSGLYKDVYYPFTSSNPYIMDVIGQPFTIKANVENKVAREDLYDINPFVDVSAASVLSITGVESPIKYPVITGGPDHSNTFYLDDVRQQIVVKIGKHGNTFIASPGIISCTQGTFAGGKVECEIQGREHKYMIKFEIEEGHNVDAIAKDIEIVINPPMTQVTSVQHSMNDMTLELSLHYYDDKNGYPNPSPIIENGVRQVKTLDFRAINGQPQTVGREGECRSRNGLNPNEQPCYCDPAAAAFDCGTGETKYCYQTSGSESRWVCTQYPMCGIGESSGPCDCDGDGTIGSTSIEFGNIDCDGSRRKYCYGGRCNADPQNFAPTLQSFEFKDTNGLIVSNGNLVKNTKYNLFVTLFDNDGIQEVKDGENRFAEISKSADEKTSTWKLVFTAPASSSTMTINAEDGRDLIAPIQIDINVKD